MQSHQTADRTNGMERPEASHLSELLDPSSSLNRQRYVKSYIEGMFWVLQYYQRGVRSWSWYYPFLYAPLASDMRDLTSLNVSLEVGRPYSPFAQLLSVLPPLSREMLPRCYSRLMTHPSSPIAHSFPADFLVDNNGREDWAGVVHIPFLREVDLRRAMDSVRPQEVLTEEEQARNANGKVHVYRPVYSNMPRVANLSGLYRPRYAEKQEHEYAADRPSFGKQPKLDIDGFFAASSHKKIKSNIQAPKKKSRRKNK